MKVSRQLRLAAATGEIRTAKFHDREHLVVPVVALVEGVVWAVNSPSPELVLASEFSVAPQGWNGRPVVPDHPSDGTSKISANDPRVLETQCFGQIFNAHVAEKRLLMEAWLDPARAAEMGGNAQNVIERAQAGEMIEISVGLFMTLEEKIGEYKGQSYTGVWHDYVPDHLAMLPEGMIGACSVEMGCGAPRAATVYLVTARGLVGIKPKEETVMSVAATNPTATVPESIAPATPAAAEVTPTPTAPDEIKPRSLRERILDMMRLRSSAGVASDMSDADLRRALDDALRNIEPMYYGIESVFPADSLVVYAVAPDNDFTLMRRTYSIRSGKIKLGDERTEVEMVTTFEPVAATAATTPQPAASTTPCGCTSQGAETMDKAQRISALIANPRTPWSEADKTYLESQTDERLTAFEAHGIEPVTAGTPPSANPPNVPASAPSNAPASTPMMPQAPPPSAPAPTTSAAVEPTTRPGSLSAGASPVTAEQYISMAPVELQESLREGLRASQERRVGVITALKATGRCDFTDEELSSHSTNGLERLLKLASVPAPPTFAGRGLARVEESGVPEPPDMIGQMRASLAARH